MLSIISDVIMCSLLIALVFLIKQLGRNELIYKKAMRIHDYIFKMDNRSIEEIDALTDQDKTIEMWNEMLWKFWKPINSFYKNTPFEKI